MSEIYEKWTVRFETEGGYRYFRDIKVYEGETRQEVAKRVGGKNDKIIDWGFIGKFKPFVPDPTDFPA